MRFVPWLRLRAKFPPNAIYLFPRKTFQSSVEFRIRELFSYNFPTNFQVHHLS